MPSQRVLSQIVDNNPALVVITDFKGTITYVNRRFCEVSGYQSEEVIGKSPNLLRGELSTTDYEQLWQTILSGRIWRGEFYNKKKNGEYYWEEAVISPIFDDEEITHFVAIKEDITERKFVQEKLEETVAEATQLSTSLEFQNAEIESQRRELDQAYKELKAAQSQMLQNEKMASIGQLAAGVAHEINNPIGFINSNLQSLGKYVGRLVEYIDFLEEGSDKNQFLEKKKRLKIDYLIEDSDDLIAESLDGTERVRKIVQNLKTFSRVDQAEEQAADINECLESTISIVWNEIKYKATLEKDLGEIPELICNPQELTQVFTNILVNAAQAIEKDGLIKVASRHDDQHIKVTITDNGCGMSQDVVDRIFEPFYTTKDVGEGTGLGMSICYEIIKKHRGKILVSSAVGEGSTFEIKLPLSE